MNVSSDRDLGRLAAGIRAAWCSRPEDLILLSRVRQTSDMYRAELAPGVLNPRVLSEDPDRRVQNVLSMVLGAPVRILSCGRDRHGCSVGLLFPAPGEVPHEHWLFVPGTCPLCHGPGPGIPLRPGDQLYAKAPAGGAPASPGDGSGGIVTWSDGHSARLKLPDGREVIIPAVTGGEVTIPAAPGPLRNDSPGVPETTAPARASDAGTTPSATARGQMVRTRARRVTRRLFEDGPAAIQPATAPGEIPAGWNALAGETAAFEAEDEDHLLGWMGWETSGMLSYGEAIAGLHEHCVDGIRLDPRAITALHDVADAVADTAQAMARAIERFREVYEAPRDFAASGRELPKDGDFLTGGGQR